MWGTQGLPDLEEVGAPFHHLPGKTGDQAIGGDQDRPRWQPPAIRVPALQVVPRQLRLRDGAAAEVYKVVTVRLRRTESEGSLIRGRIFNISDALTQ